jgi:V/A-type H+-transporting ATPase subunit I
MIAPMEKVLVAGRALDRRFVLEAVRRAGVVHVEPVERREMKALPAVRQELSMAARALEFLDAVAEPAADCCPERTPPVLIEEVLDLANGLAEIQARRVGLQKERVAALPWGGLAAEDLAALRKGGLSIEFVVSPTAVAPPPVEAELLLPVSRTKEQSYLLAVSRGPVGVRPPAAVVPQPPRDLGEIDAALTECDRREAEIREGITLRAARREDIRHFILHLRDQERFLEVEAGLHDPGEIFVLKGWVPVKEKDALTSALDVMETPTALLFSPPAEGDQPPTRFENSVWCRPIERLYTLLGVFPGYQEKDISFLFLPALTIFTGFLIADAGYAACVMLLLAFFYRSLVRKGTPRAVLDLALILFGGVFIFGALTNTWFGEALIRLSPFDGADPRSQVLLQRICFFLGAIHLTLAHALKIWKKPLALDMLAEVGWILFIWAMLALVNLLVLNDPAPAWMKPLFAVSLGLVLLFTAPSRNPLKTIGSGLGAIALNAAAFLSDIISYIRLWAVGLAGGILAASFNQLARPLPVVVMILILIPAHFLNLALGLVAVFAHGVRLNLLEFANHLGMEWSGREYQPFRKGAEGR